MDVTPGTPAKRSRAKTKESETAQAAKPTVVVKKSRATARKPAAADTPATETAVTETVITTAHSYDELTGMIATAAYYLAAERNFSPGHELDDWLEAERRIRATLFG
jgi:hypothetical protein